MSKAGGGAESLICLVFSFLFAPREKYFYYLSMFTLDKLYVGYFKLAYAEPRPYMVTEDIHPISCSKAFGNPSGHSSSSVLYFVVFFDVFHGLHYNFKNRVPNVSFYSTWWYAACLLMCTAWSLVIPMSRWMLGVHSLD